MSDRNVLKIFNKQTPHPILNQDHLFCIKRGGGDTIFTDSQ